MKSLQENNNKYILEMNNITKIYENGFVANNGVTLKVKKGEIHALLGENGAGKSTLMKVLFGQEQPDMGDITYQGKKVTISDPLKALEMGIGMVHQHFMLVESLTVAENMVLGREPKKNGLFDMQAAIRMTNEVSTKFNLPIDPTATVSDLPVGFKQRLEILKILLRGVDLLILDEPTAVLTPQETEELFVQLKNLRNEGYTIIFISHKLHEVKELCDNLTILRSGKITGTAHVSDLSERDISRLMVGREVSMEIEKNKAQPTDKVLDVRNLVYTNSDGKNVVNNISFSIRKGEILGVAGVEGNGQHEMSDIIAGMNHATSGSIKINGQEINHCSIRKIRGKRVSHISEDRMTYGIVASATIEENLISDRYFLPEYNKGFILDEKKISEMSDQLIEKFQIKCDGRDALVKTLSGGNIQKVVVAREFSSDPLLIIANQPTRGIDVGASEFIRKSLVKLRDQGCAILLISADLTEVINVSDSIIVMDEGKIVAYIEDASSETEEKLGEYMLGIQHQADEEIRRVCHE